MYVTDTIRLISGLYFLLAVMFLIWFIFKVRKKGDIVQEEVKYGIDKCENSLNK